MLKGLFARVRGWNRATVESGDVAAFRREVAAISDATPASALEALIARGRAVAGADVELELELLQGHLDAADLAARLVADGLPLVDTRHRALGGERCHFTCPATLADGESDASGRLLLGERRLLFLGGRGLAAAWGTVRAVRVDGRSLVVTIGPVTRALTCNSVSDALRAEIIATALVRPRGEPTRAPS